MSGTIRHNYHAEAESLMNKHINLELYASYVYLSMVTLTNYDRFMVS
jgi:ferritin